MLLILDEIMGRIQHDKGLPDRPRPCEYFHLIGGTSTGGLIALMLGRLRMTAREALEAYNEIAGSVFCKANRKRSYKDGAFKATTLEEQVQGLVAAKKMVEKLLPENDEEGSTKAFVCAVPAVNMAHPRLFRSYSVRRNAGTNCKIWEAARATTAAPTFFKRMTIEDDGGAKEDFLDGGLQFNNPAQLVLREALDIFGSDSNLGCLVSIGTGHPGTIGLSQPDSFQKILPTEMIGVLKRISTNCEQVAHELAGRFLQSPNRYFRYNVTHGVGSISLEEWKKMNEVQTHTKAYMEEIEVSSSIDRAVDVLCRVSEDGRPDLSMQSICLAAPEVGPKPVSRSSMKHQPVSSTLFTGREHFLGVLEVFFTDQGPGKHLRREYLLHGMGGAGKTQIALRFSEKYTQRYETVFWVDASRRDTLEQSYKSIASKLGTMPDLNCSLEVALRKLELYEGNWLLLIDGADDLEAMSGLWPPGIHGDILYTSRNPMLTRLPGSQQQSVSSMSEDEALELLLKSAHLDTSPTSYKKEAKGIVTELGSFALAVDQAGAYIASGECRIDDFLDTFNAHRQDLLQNEAYKGASGHERAVYATWDLSYTAIARRADSAATEALRQAPQAALQILQIFPFFHNEGIMEEIFRCAAENSASAYEYEPGHGPVELSPALFCLRLDGSWESRSFRLGIQTLLSFSLIGRDDSQQHFSMHRLIHVWAFDRLTADEKHCFYHEARDVLIKSIAYRWKTEDYAFRRALLPHITAIQCQKEFSPLFTDDQRLGAFAMVFFEAGRWKEAEELQVQDIDISKRVFGEEHLNTVAGMYDLALVYWYQGQWKEAEELQVRRATGPSTRDKEEGTRQGP